MGISFGKHKFIISSYILWITQLFYFLDILMKFNESFEDKGILIFERKQIFNKYITGMFFFDFLAFFSAFYLNFINSE